MKMYKKKITRVKPRGAGATSDMEKALYEQLYKQGFKAVKPKRKPPGLSSAKRRKGLGVMSDFEQKLYKRRK
jgi:hypothetical protein